MDIRKLNAAVVGAGYTQKSLCSKLGMTETTFIRKKHRDSFTLREMKEMALILSLDNPADVFFTDGLTSQVSEVT